MDKSGPQDPWSRASLDRFVLFEEDERVAGPVAWVGGVAGIAIFAYASWTVARDDALPAGVRFGVPALLMTAAIVGLLATALLAQRVRFDGLRLRATLGPFGFEVPAARIAQVDVVPFGAPRVRRRGYGVSLDGSRRLVLWQREAVVVRTTDGRVFVVGSRRAHELARALGQKPDVAHRRG